MALSVRRKENGSLLLRRRRRRVNGAGRGHEENGSHGQGPGHRLQKCNELEANAEAALTQLGLDTEIDHVTDFSQIAAYGVMTTPALVIKGKVVSVGKVLKPEEIVPLLQNKEDIL